MELSFENITNLVILYAPTIITALGMIVQIAKVLSGLKNNVKQITQSPEVTELREKLKNTQDELAVIQSQLRENIAAQYELINELSRIKKHEVEKNEEN